MEGFIAVLARVVRSVACATHTRDCARLLHSCRHSFQRPSRRVLLLIDHIAQRRTRSMYEELVSLMAELSREERGSLGGLQERNAVRQGHPVRNGNRWTGMMLAQTTDPVGELLHLLSGGETERLDTFRSNPSEFRFIVNPPI
jgi:hypothetical protein